MALLRRASNNRARLDLVAAHHRAPSELPGPRPALFSSLWQMCAGAPNQVMKSHRLRLARGLPLTWPLGRARWRPTLRIQTSEQFSQQFCFLRFADADMLATPLEIHIANALVGLRRVASSCSSDDPSACLRQVFRASRSPDGREIR